MHATAAGDAVWPCLAIANPTLLLLEFSCRTATRIADPLLEVLVIPIMPVPAIGPVASWAVYDLSLLPRDRRANLTKNLTRMMASVFDLYLDPVYRPFFVPEVENFTSRLTWIMLYFYGAMSHYSSWIFSQTQVNSVA